ncbi:DNA-binding response regulator [Helicobacter sp. MIT 00-7814]|uniref:response regulator transcription factor n=1 Tax=unclassified Helicobacter TaxID=2593540 RepID=UPI000E1E3680|nr:MULTISPECIES: response regulator transcription factor [unclassified Helicobacter]RDU52454.1 DNA-binding response regulator [Helicobacter sp. MIT 00-7814]RDU53164.1 DNA-binding response regulator [Helicobacter sp. MIT 99-10781]
MIYMLEDDTSILELVLYALNSQGLEAKGFSEVKDFKNALKESLPQIVILDVMLPNENGFEVLKWLKSNAQTKQISVIMLTALASEYEKVKGLDLGADDYLTKPFGVMELLARVRAILRRIDGKQSDFVNDGLEYSSKEHEVSINGEKIKLTLKEFELLGFFLKNPNRAFERDELLEIIWGYSAQSRTLDIHIKTLRQKLGIWGQKIKTIHGVGYKLESKTSTQ